MLNFFKKRKKPEPIEKEPDKETDETMLISDIKSIMDIRLLEKGMNTKVWFIRQPKSKVPEHLVQRAVPMNKIYDAEEHRMELIGRPIIVRLGYEEDEVIVHITEV